MFIVTPERFPKVDKELSDAYKILFFSSITPPKATAREDLQLPPVGPKPRPVARVVRAVWALLTPDGDFD
jgi:hypothetical protein